MGGIEGAQRTLVLLGDTSLKTARMTELAGYTADEAIRLVEGLSIITKSSDEALDAASLAKVMARTDLFSSTYKRCDLVTDLRSLAGADATGLTRQTNYIKSAAHQNFSRGRLYEVQTAASITRMATDYNLPAAVTKVDFISQGIRTANGATDLDAVLTLANQSKVILQCKSGALGSAAEARAWVTKAAAWAKAKGYTGVRIKYVCPTVPNAGSEIDKAIRAAIDDFPEGTLVKGEFPYIQIPTP